MLWFICMFMFVSCYKKVLLFSFVESDPEIKGMFDASWYIFRIKSKIRTWKPNSTDEVSRCKRKIKKLNKTPVWSMKMGEINMNYRGWRRWKIKSWWKRRGGSKRGLEGGWMVRGGRVEMEREASVEHGEERKPEWTIYSLWQTENNCYTASHNPLQP